MKNNNKTHQILRAEIRRFYGPNMTGTYKRALTVMRQDAESYNCGDFPSHKHTDAEKGAGLVDAGCFRCYHDDQAQFLTRIYGERVLKWEGVRIHNTYARLIGQEYAAMLREQNKRR